MEVSWEISERDPSWDMWWFFWLEIARQTLDRQSRQAGGWRMKWKGTQVMIWGFPRRCSAKPGIGEVKGCMVEKYGWTSA